MATVTTCLWFNGRVEEAARFYTEMVDGAEMGEVMYPPPGAEHATPGEAVLAGFSLHGQRFMLLNGGDVFPPSEYASIVLDCATQEEADRYWHGFIDAGGSPSDCGWLKDRYGVSWQIVPEAVNQMMMDPDPAVASAAWASMNTMQRLDSAQMARDVEAAKAERS